MLSFNVNLNLNRCLEMTRRINDKDTAEINAVLASLENVDSSIDILAEAMKIGDWNDECINDPMMPYIALLAYQENYIAEEAFASLLIYWSAQQIHGEALTPITSQHPEFKKIIASTLLPRLPNDTTVLAPNLLTLKGQYSAQLTESQLDLLFKKIKALPKSQQVIFAYKETVDLVGLSKSTNVTDKLTTLNFSPLNRSQILYKALAQLATMPNPIFAAAIKPELTSMIPTLGIMQSYLDVKFSEQAVQINPVIGLSSIDDIRQNALKAMRDLALHFPHAKLPNIADGYSAPWMHFTWHDFYHAFAASAVPHEHRKLFVELNDTIKDCLANGELDAHEIEIIEDFADSLIDMEHSYYRSLFTLLKLNIMDESLPTLFMLTLTSTLSEYLQSPLSEETARDLLEIICEFISSKPELNYLMATDYQTSIDRNFDIHNNQHPNNKLQNERVLNTAAELNCVWYKMNDHSPCFFTPNTSPNKMASAQPSGETAYQPMV